MRNSVQQNNWFIGEKSKKDEELLLHLQYGYRCFFPSLLPPPFAFFPRPYLVRILPTVYDMFT